MLSVESLSMFERCAHTLVKVSACPHEHQAPMNCTPRREATPVTRKSLHHEPCAALLLMGGARRKKLNKVLQTALFRSCVQPHASPPVNLDEQKVGWVVHALEHVKPQVALLLHLTVSEVPKGAWTLGLQALSLWANKKRTSGSQNQECCHSGLQPAHTTLRSAGKFMGAYVLARKCWPSLPNQTLGLWSLFGSATGAFGDTCGSTSLWSASSAPNHNCTTATKEATPVGTRLPACRGPCRFRRVLSDGLLEVLGQVGMLRNTVVLLIIPTTRDFSLQPSSNGC